MKKKFVIINMALVLIFTTLVGGCGRSEVSVSSTEVTEVGKTERKLEGTDEPSDEANVVTEAVKSNEEEYIPEPYIDIMDKWCAYIVETDDWCEGFAGLSECLMGSKGIEYLDNFGYRFEDFNRDGVSELVFTTNADGMSSTVLAMYGLRGDKAYFILEGYARSSYSFIGDNRLFYSGSGSAAESMYAVCDIDEQGNERKLEVYKSELSDINDWDSIVYIHDKLDKDVMLEDFVSQDEMSEFYDEYEQQIISVDVLPLGNYYSGDRTLRGSVEIASTGEISAMWAENAELVPLKYDQYMASENAKSMIAFKAEKNIKNVKFYSLHITDVSEDGKPVYAMNELYSQAELTSERPLVIGVNFMGDLPEYGISYRTNDGADKYYAISISGKDGSVQLSEF